MKPPVEIKELSQVPDYAPILAFWSFHEWYRTRSLHFDMVVEAYRERANNPIVPFSLVAVVNSLPVGMVSLKLDDLWYRKDINPWLASLFVLPEYRNQGIGGMLIENVLVKARELSYGKIYLFLGSTAAVDLENFYLKRGWIFFEGAIDNDGKDTKIFSYTLS